MCDIAIAVVIHQPASALFDMFDEAVVLRKGGLAFNGSLADMKTFVQEECAADPNLTLADRTTADWLLWFAAKTNKTMRMNSGKEPLSSKKKGKEAAGKDDQSSHVTRAAIKRGWRPWGCFVGETAMRKCAVQGLIVELINTGLTLKNGMAVTRLWLLILIGFWVCFLPFDMTDSLQPRHTIFSGTIFGIVLSWNASSYTQTEYYFLFNRRMNDIIDGVLRPSEMFMAITIIGSLVSTALGVLLTVVWVLVYVTQETSVDLFLQVLLANVLLANVYNSLGFFATCAGTNFSSGAPLSAMPRLTTVTTIITGALSFGASAWLESEAIYHLKWLQYLSPNFWYGKAIYVPWMIGRDYPAPYGLPEGLFNTCSLGNISVMGMYGGEINKALPVLVLLCYLVVLQLLSAYTLNRRLRHHHSSHVVAEEKKGRRGGIHKLSEGGGVKMEEGAPSFIINTRKSAQQMKSFLFNIDKGKSFQQKQSFRDFYSAHGTESNLNDIGL